MKITDVCWSRSQSGAGFRIFAGAGVELRKIFDRLRNLGGTKCRQVLNTHIHSVTDFMKAIKP